MPNLSEVDWRTEALAFAKEYDTRTEMVVQLVEKAMKRGAEIAVAGACEMVHAVSVDLKRKQAASAPHSNLTKTIPIEQP